MTEKTETTKSPKASHASDAQTSSMSLHAATEDAQGGGDNSVTTLKWWERSPERDKICETFAVSFVAWLWGFFTAWIIWGVK